MDETAGVFGALDMGCCTGTENDDGSDSADFEFSTRGVTGAVSPPGKLWNGGVEGIASSLGDKRVVSRVQRFHADATGSGVLGNGTLAFLSSAQTHLHRRNQTVVCCTWRCHVSVSTMCRRGP